MSAAMNATLADDDQPSVNVFCMYELSQLVQILNQLNTIDDLSKRLKKVHQFLAIYSLYQSLVYLRKPSNDVNQSLKPYYTSPVSDLLEMQKLMKNLSVELNILIRKNQQADFLAVRLKWKIVKYKNKTQTVDSLMICSSLSWLILSSCPALKSSH